MLLKSGPCFTAELELNCPTIVACVAALPVGAPAVAGDLVLGPDNQYHALPAAALSIAGNQLTITGGNTVTLPDNDTQDLSISGNVISLTNGGSVTLPTTAAPTPQVISIAGNTVSLSGGGGSVVVPDTQDLSLAGNVLSLTNGGSVTLPVSTQDPYATPAQTIAGDATALIVNPADLYARENIPAQTGLGLVLSAIPAPAANQSPWGVNTLGETLHYMPGVGWKIVSDYHQEVSADYINASPAQGVWVIGASVTAPRAGKVIITGWAEAEVNPGGVIIGHALGLARNGAVFEQHNIGSITPVGTPYANAATGSSPADFHSALSYATTVAQGDVFSAAGMVFSNWTIRNHIQITYVS
jgi:hypothetical protein